MLLAGFAAMAALLIFGDFNTVGGRGGAPAAQPAQPARLARFNSSCRATVASDLDQGLTLLYAFEYTEARAVFVLHRVLLRRIDARAPDLVLRH